MLLQSCNHSCAVWDGIIYSDEFKHNINNNRTLYLNIYKYLSQNHLISYNFRVTMPTSCVETCKNSAKKGFVMKRFSTNVEKRTIWTQMLCRPD